MILKCCKVLNFAYICFKRQNFYMENKGFDFFTTLNCKDDFEVTKSLVHLYSTSCVLRNKSTKVLRSQLIHLVALYLKFGFSKETRKTAAATFEVDIKHVNHMNFELSEKGYLVVDNQEGGKKLNEELMHLRNNYLESVGKRPPCFIFVLQEDEE